MPSRSAERGLLRSMKSIRWRLVAIYLLLILLAMELVSVYLLQSLERYYVSAYSATVASQAQLVAGFLRRYMVAEVDAPRIDQIVQEFSRQTNLDIVVLRSTGELLSSSNDDLRYLERMLSQSEIARALTGGRGEAVGKNPVTGERCLHLVEPVRAGDRVTGAVYVVASLEETYRTLGDIRRLLIYATVLALCVTAVLGLIVSQTITRPIVEVTAKARQMASGKFDQRIEVRSEDEIGELGTMFNHLTLKLSDTLREMGEEKAKLEAILTHMADGVLAVDGEQKVIAINPVACRMLGGNQRDLIGNPLPEAIAKVLGMGCRAASEKVKIGGRVLLARYASFRNERGGSPGVVAVLQDITEGERLENMRKDFVANVSHELRTPLTTVRSYVETLLDGAVRDDAVARQFLSVVLRETERMTRLVRDLLDLAQLDHKEAALDIRPGMVDDVVAEAVSRIRPQAEKKGLTLTLETTDGSIKAHMDAGRIEQVLLNIIANSIEFTKPGGTIRVKVWRSGGAVNIGVVDTGIGIPSEDLPRLFERFYRVEKARSRELGGTGLGLAIAKEIVQAHGGDISISSKVGEGTEVVFWLPLADGATPSGPSRVGDRGGTD